MSPPRARVLRAGETATVQPLLAPQIAGASHRRIAREEVEARFAAERIEQEARVRAEAILAEARAHAVAAGEQAQAEAREQAHATAIAQWIAVRRAEDARLQAEGDRVVALAVLLAERLVGAALEVTPERIGSPWPRACWPRRAARAAPSSTPTPLDAEHLRDQLAIGSGSPRARSRSATIRPLRAARSGYTPTSGTLDAQLAPRLERLASALRDALAPDPADAPGGATTASPRLGWRLNAGAVSRDGRQLLRHRLRPLAASVAASTRAQFTASLLAILLAHEFGHYFAARIHKVDASLPYFLPHAHRLALRHHGRRHPHARRPSPRGARCSTSAPPGRSRGSRSRSRSTPGASRTRSSSTWSPPPTRSSSATRCCCARSTTTSRPPYPRAWTSCFPRGLRRPGRGCS